MDPFDGNAYRKNVLARLADDFSLADVETGDPFFLFDLALDADQASVLSRLADVIAFWQKERNGPKYKGIASELVNRRGQYEKLLRDPAARQALTVEIKARRAAADAHRFGTLDRMARQLTERFGGIPGDRVERLRTLARRNGATEPAFTDWLGQYRVLAAKTTAAEPWSSSIRYQLRDHLKELARQTGDLGRYTTLWTFLGVSATCSKKNLQMRYDELQAQNQKARHDNVKTRTGELLAHVKTRLMQPAGRDTYAASLQADAVDLIHDDIAEKAVVDGEVTAADHELLVHRIVGLGWGLDSDDARAVIRSAAATLGVSLAVAPAVDYVVCARCRTPQTAPEYSLAITCRYCVEPLFQSCPECSHLVESAAATCPECGASITATREARELIARAREALAAGRPAEAGCALDEAAAIGPALGGDGEKLRASVAAILAAAGQKWVALERDITGHRLWSAYDRAVQLERSTADVRGPGGATASQRRVELAAAKAEVQRQIQTASRLLPDDAEAVLSRVLIQAVDCPEAAQMLARLPLAGPMEVLARPDGDAIALEWRPARIAGAAVYRVVRVEPRRGQSPLRTTIATTSATSMEDAGAPGGVELGYEISALSGSRSSAPSASRPQVLLRDVSAVRAQSESGKVKLFWALVPGNGSVLVERVTEVVGPDGGKLVQQGPLRRIHPSRPDHHVDTDVTAGPTYTYRVFVEYRRPDEPPVRTDGCAVSIRIEPRLEPVRRLSARTGTDQTVVSFASPPDGVVQLYARTGPKAEPLGGAGTVLGASELAALSSTARLVGEDRRRVVDAIGTGRIVYTPVTVIQDRAIIGEALEHLAVGEIANLAAVERSSGLLVTFELPRGATEVFVRWRFGPASDGAEEPECTVKLTNTKLELAGGFEIAAVKDGRSLTVTVQAAVRIGGKLVPGPHSAVLQARPGPADPS